MSGGNRNQKVAIIALIAVIILIIIALFLIIHILQDIDFSVVSNPFQKQIDTPAPTQQSQSTFSLIPPSEPIPSPKLPSTPKPSFSPSLTPTLTQDTLSDFDTVFFGNYMDNPIEWIVLESQKDRQLLLSKRALETLPFHNTDDPVTWETCSLRAWLNSEFFESAFSTEEAARILLTLLDNSSVNPDFHYTEGSDPTEDRVFLLSHDEVIRLLPTQDVRLCEKSLHAPSYDNDISQWWLRSPGLWPNCAEYISRAGTFFSGIENRQYVDVRPALWIEIAK